ncbi:MAG: GFA family protein [Paracoccaceae bacterium]
MAKGGCLCGAVTYEVSGDLRPVIACHCGQCRKTSGHYWAATQAPTKEVQISNLEGKLTWYKSSDWARRGFCAACGSSLFWEMKEEGAMSIAAGSLDAPTGLSITSHIFVADKGDYYQIEDGPEQIARF